MGGRGVRYPCLSLWHMHVRGVRLLPLLRRDTMIRVRVGHKRSRAKEGCVRGGGGGMVSGVGVGINGFLWNSIVVIGWVDELIRCGGRDRGWMGSLLFMVRGPKQRHLRRANLNWLLASLLFGCWRVDTRRRERFFDLFPIISSITKRQFGKSRLTTRYQRSPS